MRKVDTAILALKIFNLVVVLFPKKYLEQSLALLKKK